MAIKIGIANRKGGIGKSSTALALAAGLQNLSLIHISEPTRPY